MGAQESPKLKSRKSKARSNGIRPGAGGRANVECRILANRKRCSNLVSLCDFASFPKTDKVKRRNTEGDLGDRGSQGSVYPSPSILRSRQQKGRGDKKGYDIGGGVEETAWSLNQAVKEGVGAIKSFVEQNIREIRQQLGEIEYTYHGDGDVVPGRFQKSEVLDSIVQENAPPQIIHSKENSAKSAKSHKIKSRTPRAKGTRNISPLEDELGHPRIEVSAIRAEVAFRGHGGSPTSFTVSTKDVESPIVPKEEIFNQIGTVVLGDRNNHPLTPAQLSEPPGLNLRTSQNSLDSPWSRTTQFWRRVNASPDRTLAENPNLLSPIDPEYFGSPKLKSKGRRVRLPQLEKGKTPLGGPPNIPPGIGSAHQSSNRVGSFNRIREYEPYGLITISRSPESSIGMSVVFACVAASFFMLYYVVFGANNKNKKRKGIVGKKGAWGSIISDLKSSGSRRTYSPRRLVKWLHERIPEAERLGIDSPRMSEKSSTNSGTPKGVSSITSSASLGKLCGSGTSCAKRLSQSSISPFSFDHLGKSPKMPSSSDMRQPIRENSAGTSMDLLLHVPSTWDAADWRRFVSIPGSLSWCPDTNIKTCIAEELKNDDKAIAKILADIDRSLKYFEKALKQQIKNFNSEIAIKTPGLFSHSLYWLTGILGSSSPLLDSFFKASEKRIGQIRQLLPGVPETLSNASAFSFYAQHKFWNMLGELFPPLHKLLPPNEFDHANILKKLWMSFWAVEKYQHGLFTLWIISRFWGVQIWVYALHLPLYITPVYRRYYGEDIKIAQHSGSMHSRANYAHLRCLRLMLAWLDLEFIERFRIPIWTIYNARPIFINACWTFCQIFNWCVSLPTIEYHVAWLILTGQILMPFNVWNGIKIFWDEFFHLPITIATHMVFWPCFALPVAAIFYFQKALKWVLQQVYRLVGPILSPLLEPLVRCYKWTKRVLKSPRPLFPSTPGGKHYMTPGGRRYVLPKQLYQELDTNKAAERNFLDSWDYHRARIDRLRMCETEMKRNSKILQNNCSGLEEIIAKKEIQRHEWLLSGVAKQLKKELRKAEDARSNLKKSRRAVTGFQGHFDTGIGDLRIFSRDSFRGDSVFKGKDPVQSRFLVEEELRDMQIIIKGDLPAEAVSKDQGPGDEDAHKKKGYDKDDEDTDEDTHPPGNGRLKDGSGEQPLPPHPPGGSSGRPERDGKGKGAGGSSSPVELPQGAPSRPIDKEKSNQSRNNQASTKGGPESSSKVKTTGVLKPSASHGVSDDDHKPLSFPPKAPSQPRPTRPPPFASSRLTPYQEKPSHHELKFKSQLPTIREENPKESIVNPQVVGGPSKSGPYVYGTKNKTEKFDSSETNTSAENNQAATSKTQREHQSSRPPAFDMQPSPTPYVESAPVSRLDTMQPVQPFVNAPSTSEEKRFKATLNPVPSKSNHGHMGEDLSPVIQPHPSNAIGNLSENRSLGLQPSSDRSTGSVEIRKAGVTENRMLLPIRSNHPTEVGFLNMERLNPSKLPEQKLSTAKPLQNLATKSKGKLSHISSTDFRPDVSDSLANDQVGTQESRNKLGVIENKNISTNNWGNRRPGELVARVAAEIARKEERQHSSQGIKPQHPVPSWRIFESSNLETEASEKPEMFSSSTEPPGSSSKNVKKGRERNDKTSSSVAEEFRHIENYLVPENPSMRKNYFWPEQRRL
ncbi:hypothetical protein TWF694_006647 [Orbilia ellipsospora]|uniref:Uncharacterized protein n=1 Tax=Orbilia ellipsospora TaxID=2528407 RepID=A0AAV9XSG9_9PEZI